MYQEHFGLSRPPFKITPDTKVFVNGNKVDLLRARERARQDAYIEFDRETAEVKHIYWSE